MKILGDMPPEGAKVGTRRLRLKYSTFRGLAVGHHRKLKPDNLEQAVEMLRAQGEALPTEGYICQLPRMTLFFDYQVASEEWYEEAIRQEAEREERVKANHVTYEMIIEDCKACNASNQKWMDHWRHPEMGHWAVCSLQGETDPRPMLFDGFGSCINYLIHECGAEYPVNDNLFIAGLLEILKLWCDHPIYQEALQNIKSRGSFVRVTALFYSDQPSRWYSIEWFKEPLKRKE